MKATPSLANVTAAVLAAVPGAAYAGIIRPPGHDAIHGHAPTQAIAGILDRLHNELGDGPGATALREQRTVTVPDLGAATRWPDFTALAAELGVRSVLCVPLYVDDIAVGALTLYATAAQAFTADDETVVGVFATRAAYALHGVPQRQHPADALVVHDVIEQATGALMASHHITATEASAMLERVSQDTQRTRDDLARELVDGHDRPVEPGVPALRARSSAQLTVVELVGDVDILTVPQLREHLALLPATDTLVDLSQVTFLAVEGLRMLRQRSDELDATGRALRVTGAAPSQHRILALAGLQEDHADTTDTARELAGR